MANILIDAFDSDCSNDQSTREMGRALHTERGMRAPAAQMIALLQKYDADQGGTLDREEFVRLVRHEFEPKEPAWRAEARARLMRPNPNHTRRPRKERGASSESRTRA